MCSCYQQTLHSQPLSWRSSWSHRNTEEVFPRVQRSKTYSAFFVLLYWTRWCSFSKLYFYLLTRLKREIFLWLGWTRLCKTYELSYMPVRCNVCALCIPLHYSLTASDQPSWLKLLVGHAYVNLLIHHRQKIKASKVTNERNKSAPSPVTSLHY